MGGGIFGGNDAAKKAADEQRRMYEQQQNQIKQQQALENANAMQDVTQVVAGASASNAADMENPLGLGMKKKKNDISSMLGL